MTILAITSTGYALLGFLLFSLCITYYVVKRSEKDKNESQKSGCFFMIIWIVIFFTGMMSIWGSFSFISQTINNGMAIANGHQYTAKVVDWTSEWKESGNKHKYRTRKLYYTPILEFETNEGKWVRKSLSYSSTGIPVKGKAYIVYYNEKEDKMLVWYSHTIISYFGMLLIGILSSFVFYGAIVYALGCPIIRYIKVYKNFVVKFLIPFSLISCAVVLVFALFSADSLLSAVFLLFFILVLLATVFGWFFLWKKIDLIINKL